MHETAALLALRGYRLCIYIATSQLRIKRNVKQGEWTLAWQPKWREWARCPAVALDLYHEIGWDRIDPDEADCITKENILSLEEP